jgi:hypothetical protein
MTPYSRKFGRIRFEETGEGHAQLGSENFLAPVFAAWGVAPKGKGDVRGNES